LPWLCGKKRSELKKKRKRKRKLKISSKGYHALDIKRSGKKQRKRNKKNRKNNLNKKIRKTGRRIKQVNKKTGIGCFS
jgi:hypothetical protein